MTCSFVAHSVRMRGFAGILCAVVSVLFGACASASQVPRISAPPAVPDGAIEAEQLLVYFEDGPAEIRLDLTAVEAAGFNLPEDVSFIELFVRDSMTGEVVLNAALHDLHRDDIVWDEQPWSLAGIDSSRVEVTLNLHLTQQQPNYFSFAQRYGPVELVRPDPAAATDAPAADGPDTPTAQTIHLRPLPDLEEGLVAFEARNETGLGRPGLLGVFLRHEQSGASFHFHMYPGSRFLVYERNISGLKPGSYSVSIRADQENWPREGNAVWEGEFAFVPGESHLVGGEMSEYIALWDRGISLQDLILNDESEVYRTEFEDPDPRMSELHVSADGEARFEEGNLVVSGEGDLSGGVNFRVVSGRNTMVQLRALLPEDGEYFLNTRFWGHSRMAVIVRPDTPESSAHLEMFANDPQGRTLSDQHALLPRITPNRWYDYSFVDLGDKLLVFIDDTLSAIFPIPSELTDQGELGIEWHRPGRFAELRVIQAASIDLPPELRDGE